MSKVKLRFFKYRWRRVSIPNSVRVAMLIRIHTMGLNASGGVLGYRKNGNRTYYLDTGLLRRTTVIRNNKLIVQHYAKYLEQRFSRNSYDLSDHELDLLVDDYLDKIFPD